MAKNAAANNEKAMSTPEVSGDPNSSEATPSEPSYEELKQRLADLEKAKERHLSTISFKVGEKGGLCVYGLMRFPITLYVEQWERLLADDTVTRLRKFMKDNADKFKRIDRSVNQ
jgi:hypothetical protein